MRKGTVMRTMRASGSIDFFRPCSSGSGKMTHIGTVKVAKVAKSGKVSIAFHFDTDIEVRPGDGELSSKADELPPVRECMMVADACEEGD